MSSKARGEASSGPPGAVLPPASQGDPGQAPARAPRTTLAPAQDALPTLFRDFRERGDGLLITILGDRGWGKTNVLQFLVQAICAERSAKFGDLVGPVLVLDDKGWPQYEGCQRVNLADAAARLPDQRVVVFTGDKARGVRCMPEELALRVRELLFLTDAEGRPAGVRAALILDEGKRATNADSEEGQGSGKRWTAPTMHWLCTESRQVGQPGRPLGATIIGVWQLPQEIPRSADNNSMRIVVRSGDNSANYMRSSWNMPQGFADTVQRLEVGQFVVSEQGRTDWDGRIFVTPHMPRPDADSSE